MKRLDVLAIAAHPDDAEVSCGGLLIRMADLGYRTGVLDLTRGEMGSRGTPRIRQREAAAAGAALGLAARLNAGLPDGRLALDDESRAVVAHHIRQLRPKLAVIPSAGQRHPDHNAAGEIAYAGIFAAGLRKFPAQGTPFRPDRILYTSFDCTGTPSFYVDITEQMERKLKAIAAYRSQFGEAAAAGSNGQDVYSKVRAMARYGGLCTGVEYAEGFRIRESIRLDDPLAELRLKSI